jgi:ferredoxin
MYPYMAKRHAAKVSTKLRIGSKRFAKLNVHTPIVSRRHSTQWLSRERVTTKGSSHDPFFWLGIHEDDMAGVREGNLEAPKRRPIDWQNPEFYAEDSLYHELERVFDICHGCRRCVSLCNSFPTLFDLVDESPTLEVDGIPKFEYTKVVDQCYLCDLCAETKCPYLPPHEWAVDFPHLMLRAKAYRFKNDDTKRRDRLITSTDSLFNVLSTPGIGQLQMLR